MVSVVVSVRSVSGVISCHLQSTHNRAYLIETKDETLKAIVFAFAPGQELSQHTASVPAIIQILEGECDLTVGGTLYQAVPGSWVHLEANLPHSLLAHTPVKMLLLMMG